MFDQEASSAVESRHVKTDIAGKRPTSSGTCINFSSAADSTTTRWGHRETMHMKFSNNIASIYAITDAEWIINR
jgi:hypothetical protein